MTDVKTLAAEARALADTEWGSARHFEAENKFFDEARKAMTQDQRDALEDFCLNATSDEMIAEALKALGIE